MNMPTINSRRPKVATVPPDEDAPIADVRTHLRERTNALNGLRGEMREIEQRISAIRAVHLLDEPIDAAELVALGEKRDTLQAIITEEASVVSGLQARVDAFDAAVGKRRHAVIRAELEALTATAVREEADYQRLAEALIARAGTMAANASHARILGHEAFNLERRYGLAPVRARSPHRAIPIPESYFKVGSRAREFSGWLAGQIANRSGWAGRERPAVSPPIETSTDLRRFKVLRDFRLPTRLFGPDDRYAREFSAGRTEELPAALGDWIQRDSPGSIEPVGAK